jgi:putative ABC transport system permease protein
VKLLDFNTSVEVFMFNVRWYKVFNDLLGNKTRTALIVLSITVGLFAIGMIASARIILFEEMNKSYVAIHPSSGVIRTIQTFDQDFVRSVRRMSGVADADARTHLWMRFQLKHKSAQGAVASAAESTSRWRDLQIFAVPDYDALRVNRIEPQKGAWPPALHELLIERSSLDLIGAQIGDALFIETSDRKVCEMHIAGVVHDFAELPAQFDGSTYVYISFDTLEWLGEPRGLILALLEGGLRHGSSSDPGQLQSPLKKMTFLGYDRVAPKLYLTEEDQDEVYTTLV